MVFIVKYVIPYLRNGLTHTYSRGSTNNCSSIGNLSCSRNSIYNYNSYSSSNCSCNICTSDFTPTEPMFTWKIIFLRLIQSLIPFFNMLTPIKYNTVIKDIKVIRVWNFSPNFRFFFQRLFLYNLIKINLLHILQPCLLILWLRFPNQIHWKQY